MSWALIKDGKVVQVEPSPIQVVGVKPRDLRKYHWHPINESDGIIEVGDEFYSGKFVTENTFVPDQSTFKDVDHYYKFIKRSDIKTIFSSNMHTYTELVTDSLDPGTYKISWTYSWNIDTTSYDFIAEIIHELPDNSTVSIFNQVQEIKDAGGNFKNTKSAQKFVASSFTTLDLEGINKFRLNFGTENKKKYASMWHAVIDISRIG